MELLHPFGIQPTPLRVESLVEQRGKAKLAHPGSPMFPHDGDTSGDVDIPYRYIFYKPIIQRAFRKSSRAKFVNEGYSGVHPSATSSRAPVKKYGMAELPLPSLRDVRLLPRADEVNPCGVQVYCCRRCPGQ